MEKLPENNHQQHPLEDEKESILDAPEMAGGFDTELPDEGMPFEDNRDEAMQLKSYQQVANGSDRVQQHKSLQQRINNSPRMVMQRKEAPNGGIIQRKKVFAHDGDSFETKKTDKTAMDIAWGSTSQKLSSNADPNLPTPYEVLHHHFKDDVNQFIFKAKKNSTYDRPRRVKARITARKVSERDDPITSDIGNMGDDELMIREGKQKSFYDGGHLIGAKILGDEAAEAYNIAPQESEANEHFYNNTIETILRGVNSGVIYDYDVQINYAKNNFKVDQQQLVNAGVLSKLYDDKPWEIYIPSRIPKSWSAKAKIVSGGTWGKLSDSSTTKDKGLSSPDEVKGKKMGAGTGDTHAAFAYDRTSATEVNFFMQQHVPKDPVSHPKPKSVKTARNLDTPGQYEDKAFDPKSARAKLPSKCGILVKAAQQVIDYFNNHEDAAYFHKKVPNINFPVDDGHRINAIDKGKELKKKAREAADGWKSKPKQQAYLDRVAKINLDRTWSSTMSSKRVQFSMLKMTAKHEIEKIRDEMKYLYEQLMAAKGQMTHFASLDWKSAGADILWRATEECDNVEDLLRQQNKEDFNNAIARMKGKFEEYAQLPTAKNYPKIVEKAYLAEVAEQIRGLPTLPGYLRKRRGSAIVSTRTSSRLKRKRDTATTSVTSDTSGYSKIAGTSSHRTTKKKIKRKHRRRKTGVS